MSGHSPMVSLRIPEDHLLALDQRVGFDGMRNRSDVIRDAVRRLLELPLIGHGEKVQVNLGSINTRINNFNEGFLQNTCRKP